MFKLCTKICRLICIVGLSLLAPVAGSVQPEPQRVAQESLQASRPAAERAWQAQDRQLRVTPDKQGVPLVDLNNAVASTAGRQPEAQEDESASTSTRAPKSEAEVDLTEEENAWLTQHPEIVLGAPTDYPPMVIKRADGTHIGVLVDLFEQISRYLDTRIGLHIEDSWADIQEKAQDREIDGLAFGGRDPRREALYNATDIVTPTYFSVFGRSVVEYQIKSFADLDGLRIGYKRAARPTRSLLENLPSATLKPYDSHESMTQALLSREIDVIVAWMSYDHWRKVYMQGTIDNILLIDEYPIEMVTYVRKDWPELIPILNKAISALQKDELPAITNKWFGDWPQSSQASRVSLTPEEQAWINKKYPVRVRIVDWPPYQIVENDEPPRGIVVEYLRLIGERTGITFKTEVTEQPFAEFLEDMKQGWGPDLTPVIVPTPARREYLSFSETYIASPYVIFMRKTDEAIFDIRGLTGKTLAVPRGFVVQEQLAGEYPEIGLALLDSDEEALQAVATGQADAYIGNLAVSSHIIHKRGFTDLRVTAASPFGEQTLAAGNRKDWPELTSIINKALASITEEEKTAIRNKYLAIKYEHGIDKTEALKWALIIGGAATGFVLIFVFWNRRLSHEITIRRQAEQKLKQARDDAEAANRAKSTFLASMSHELRSPLHAILGFSGRLAQDRNTPADQRDKLSIINRSGENLLSLINDLLDLSKIEAGRDELKDETFDLSAMLKEVAGLYQFRMQEAGLRFSLDIDAKLPRYTKADAGRIRQILLNLLSNAAKHTRQGGIDLRAENIPVPGDPTATRLRLEVEDSGEGISPEIQPRIFDAFYQAENRRAVAKGTGLGLAISKSCVEMMGGRIGVRSTPGKGSIFRVEVPVALAGASELPKRRSAAPAVLGLASGQTVWRILVVEDNDDNRLLLSSLLRDQGFEVREAENGEQAIELFQLWRPHLIWMDMRMPVLDGYEAARRIRGLSDGEAVKIIAITANAFDEQRPDILSAGCDEVVYKPFRDQEILDTIARLLGVKYRTEDSGSLAEHRSATTLTVEMLDGLPRALRQDLSDAALVLDMDAIEDVIQRIQALAPETAQHLQALVKDFEMARIRKLLDQAQDDREAIQTRSRGV